MLFRCGLWLARLFAAVVFLRHGTVATTYAKTDSGLTAVPGDIPAGVTAVDLSFNQLATVSPAALAHLTELVTLDLTVNRLTAVPALPQNVGATLQTLNLTDNDITTVAAGDLAGLSVLTELVLKNNPLATSPVLSDVGGTLRSLNIRGVGLDTYGSTLLSPLTVLEHLDVSGNGVVDVLPPLTEVADTLVSITADFNQINAVILQILNSFVKIAELSLRGNQFGAFPILGTRPLLRRLNLANNVISSVSGAVLQGLVALEELDLSGNPLGPAGWPVGAVLPSPLHTLLLASTGITALPDVATLTTLNVDDNPGITTISAEQMDALPTLHTLSARGTGLLSLPPGLGRLTVLDVSECPALAQPSLLTVAALSNLTRLALQDVTWAHLPTTCPKNVSSLEVDVQGASVQLCRCDNVWLKAAADAGATVLTDEDVVCGDTTWMEHSTGSLLDVCDNPAVSSGVGVRVRAARLRVARDSPCAFPLHPHQHERAVSRTRCFHLCRQVLGCEMFNFLPAANVGGARRGPSMGRCVLVAPSPSGGGGEDELLGNDEGAAAWELFAMDGELL